MPVEYVEESTYATQDDGTSSWNWFGIGTSWSATQGANTESIRYLPQYGSTNKLSKRVNIKQSEMWEGEITYHPQNFDLLKFFTGSDGGTSDTVPSIQIGEINEDASTDEFRNLMGGVGSEFALTIDEDSTAEVSGSFTFADGTDWTTSDYVDDTSGGSHATEDSTEPFAYKDLSNITYGGTDLSGAVSSIELSVSNDLATVKDPEAGRDSLIAALVPTNREITLSVELTYDGFDLAQEVRSYTPKDFAFDLGTTTFTVNDVRFPEFSYELSPEDLVGDSIDSDPATDLSWTTA